MNREYPTFLNTPAKRAKWAAAKRARPHRARANPNAPISANQYPAFLNTASKRERWQAAKRARKQPAPQAQAGPAPARVPFSKLEQKRAAAKRLKEAREQRQAAAAAAPAAPAAPAPKPRGRPKVKKIDKLKAEFKEAHSLATGEGGGTMKKRKPNKFNLEKEKKEFQEMIKRMEAGEPLKVKKSKKSIEDQIKELHALQKKAEEGLPKKKAAAKAPAKQTPPPKRKEKSAAAKGKEPAKKQQITKADVMKAGGGGAAASPPAKRKAKAPIATQKKKVNLEAYMKDLSGADKKKVKALKDIRKVETQTIKHQKYLVITYYSSFMEEEMTSKYKLTPKYSLGSEEDYEKEDF